MGRAGKAIHLSAHDWSALYPIRRRKIPANAAYPEMRRLGYSKQLASGSNAAGGTLGILLTPPPGMNVFVIKGLLPDVSTRKIFQGVAPFVVADVFRLAILVAFPSISLYLTRFVN